MPQYEFVDNEIIEAVIAPTGDVRRIWGIPDPEKSRFISESEAIEFAKKVGLEEGIEIPEDLNLKPLRTSFHHNIKFNAYVWSVSNVTYIGRDKIGGESVLIEAYSGKVLKRGKWMIMPGYHPRAPEGTPLRVYVRAVYRDESGRIVMEAGSMSRQRTVAGVQITVTDARGNSQTITTSRSRGTGEEPISFELLAGYDYTVTASFNGSTRSIPVTVGGYDYHGGWIEVYIGENSNIIERVSYHEPKLA
jgi:hypothetical protein